MKVLIHQSIKLFSVIYCVLVLWSCGAYLNQPTKTRAARFGEATPMTSELMSLPKTSTPVIAAVYKFRDQTGQYKPSENGANWSTSVTQGATTILLKALEDSGWFVTVERENVSNLLNERKILRSSKSQLDGSQGNKLPPLYYAGIILEGGIISYDANIMTGGVGARYFGTGAAAQYRQDRVSIYLRAVSTKTGEILKTVYTSKTILSQGVDVGVFRYVSFKRLLEAETGFTYNEPVELAVTEAIEKAVYNLIIEGLMDGYWRADTLDIDKDQRILAYQAEKMVMSDTDLFGRNQNNFRKKSWFEVNGTFLRLQGDLRKPLVRPGVEMGIGCLFYNNLGCQFDFGYQEYKNERYYSAQYISSELNLIYQFLPLDKATPNFKAGLCAITDFPAYSTFFCPTVGVDVEFLLHSRIAGHVGMSYKYLLTDDTDSVIHGKYNDYILKADIGLKYYF